MIKLSERRRKRPVGWPRREHILPNRPAGRRPCSLGVSFSALAMIHLIVGVGVAVIRIEALDHPHHGKRETAGKQNLVPLRNGVTECSIKRLACERGDKNCMSETSGAEGRLASGKNGSTDAATCPIGMNEEGADASRVVRWVKGGVRRESCAVAAEHGATTTPAAAADEVAAMLDDEVSAVADKLTVHAEDGTQCCLHLCGRVERSLQTTHGERNERLQSLDVILSRQTY